MYLLMQQDFCQGKQCMHHCQQALFSSIQFVPPPTEILLLNWSKRLQLWFTSPKKGMPKPIGLTHTVWSKLKLSFFLPSPSLTVHLYNCEKTDFDPLSDRNMTAAFDSIFIFICRLYFFNFKLLLERFRACEIIMYSLPCKFYFTLCLK